MQVGQTVVAIGSPLGLSATVTSGIVSAQGRTQRSCYSYDTHGRQVSETPPRAGLTSCPTLSFNPPAVTATMPSPGFPAVAPTFPDGSTGSGGPVNPVDPPCGYGGVACQ